MKLEDTQLDLVCGGMSSIIPDIVGFVVIGIMALGICTVFTADPPSTGYRYEYDEEEARMRRVRANDSVTKHNLQPNSTN